MSEVAQVITAIGVAAFLILLALAGVVWAFRCNARSDRYRYPVILSVPVIIATAAALQQLLGH